MPSKITDRFKNKKPEKKTDSFFFNLVYEIKNNIRDYK